MDMPVLRSFATEILKRGMSDSSKVHGMEHLGNTACPSCAQCLHITRHPGVRGFLFADERMTSGKLETGQARSNSARTQAHAVPPSMCSLG